jgi:hypothetical protein
MRYATAFVAAAGLLFAPSVATATTGGLSACDYQASYGDIPCTEVDRAITESAREFGVDETRLRVIARCESGFNPFAGNGPYQGMFQQAADAWGARAGEFNAAVDPDVPGDIHSPFDNTRVSARMLAIDGDSHWPNC